jgi:hypothetical protein
MKGIFESSPDVEFTAPPAHISRALSSKMSIKKIVQDFKKSENETSDTTLLKVELDNLKKVYEDAKTEIGRLKLQERENHGKDTTSNVNAEEFKIMEMKLKDATNTANRLQKEVEELNKNLKDEMDRKDKEIKELKDLSGDAAVSRTNNISRSAELNSDGILMDEQVNSIREKYEETLRLKEREINELKSLLNASKESDGEHKNDGKMVIMLYIQICITLLFM